MPCVGPEPWEIAAMEIDECERLYGVRDTELNIATRVACHLANGESNALTRKWIAVHAKRDAARKAQEEEHRRREAADREIRQAARKIRRKHGLI